MRDKNKTIEVRVEWFERLQDLYGKYDNSHGSQKEMYLDMLLSYVSSVDVIIKLLTL